MLCAGDAHLERYDGLDNKNQGVKRMLQESGRNNFVMTTDRAGESRESSLTCRKLMKDYGDNSDDSGFNILITTTIATNILKSKLRRIGSQWCRQNDPLITRQR